MEEKYHDLIDRYVRNDMAQEENTSWLVKQDSILSFYNGYPNMK